jgi:hypothetical protein
MVFMYKIEKKSYGFKITFSDIIDAKEMQKWVDESKKALFGNKGNFGVMVDMRDLAPLSAEAQTVMVNGQQLFKTSGMERSAVILKSNIVTNQFKRLAQSSGIYKWERYINATSFPKFEAVAENWIAKGIDPDL